MSAVFEVNGVWASGDKDHPGMWLEAHEVGEDKIMFTKSNEYKNAYLTIDEARALARQLYRIAGRVEKRGPAK